MKIKLPDSAANHSAANGCAPPTGPRTHQKRTTLNITQRAGQKEISEGVVRKRIPLKRIHKAVRGRAIALKLGKETYILPSKDGTSWSQLACLYEPAKKNIVNISVGRSEGSLPPTRLRTLAKQHKTSSMSVDGTVAIVMDAGQCPSLAHLGQSTPVLSEIKVLQGAEMQSPEFLRQALSPVRHQSPLPRQSPAPRIADIAKSSSLTTLSARRGSFAGPNSNHALVAAQRRGSPIEPSPSPSPSPPTNLRQLRNNKNRHNPHRYHARMSLQEPRRHSRPANPFTPINVARNSPHSTHHGVSSLRDPALDSFRRDLARESHSDWPTYTFVEIFVSNLPPQSTTADIYRNFADHGNINEITFQKSQSDSLARRAEIKFKPPPKVAFWPDSRHRFVDANGRYFNKHRGLVRVVLSGKQLRNFSKPSEVRNDVVYNSEMVLEAQSIRFGVLSSPSSMMVMRTRPSVNEDKVRFVVNLHFREIEIYFPSLLRSKNKDAVRQYRFRISFDQTFSILQVQEPGGMVSFVIQLDVPPPYSKKLKEDALTTHDPESTKWREAEMWLRQTDIVDHKDDFATIATLPISLKNSQNSINVGRWTTFCITFDQNTSQTDEFRICTEALRDFGVTTSFASTFAYIDSPPPIWDLLDRHLESSLSPQSHARASSFEEEFANVALPFAVRYLLEVCISNGKLSEYVVDEIFLRKLVEVEEREACRRLKHILDLPPQLIDPMDFFDDRKMLGPPPRREPGVPENCVKLHSATVTATSIIFHAPAVEVSNRIIRQYHQQADRFLRIRFEDDMYRGNSKINPDTTRRMNEIFRRVRRTLSRGINMGDLHYEFLAWGNSQLREHGAYFFASLPGVITASQIRGVMGRFDQEKIIAKRAARMGQCFSTTKAVKLRIPRIDKAVLIEDIVRNGFTFTDGVGKMSPMLSKWVEHEFKAPNGPPSVVQFRLGGCKGVLAVSTDLPGINVKIRKSQFKFPSEAGELEIIRYSDFASGHLNRQLITVLSALGVQDHVFLDIQDREVTELNKAMDHDQTAVEKLKTFVDPNHKTLEIADMISSGFRKTHEPFVTSLLRLWRAWTIKDIKEKAKIPLRHSAQVLGCIDETGTLNGHFDNRQVSTDADHQQRVEALAEIFIQVPVHDTKPRKYIVIEGLCFIARNPSLHKGDIRIVKAVNVPALSHLHDVLVLPQTGDRDLSNMCSGGDLDGDDYIVVWADPADRDNFELLPKIWNAEPMDYTPPDPIRAAGDVTQNDIIKFFHQYMRNDFLGRIAHAHLGWADDTDDGVESDQCLELARLHSVAVDYAKTGVPARLEKRLDRHTWPHFMERKFKKYKSHKVLGKMFDAAQAAEYGTQFKPVYDIPFDHRILNACNPSQEVLQFMAALKEEYDISVRRILAKHEIGTEFEVWSTFALDHSRASPDFKFHEELGNLSRSLIEQFREEIIQKAGRSSQDVLAEYAVAAYQITSQKVDEALTEVKKGTKEKTPEHMPYISFPWVLHDVLNKIAVAADQDHRQTTEATLDSETTNDGMLGDISNRAMTRQRLQDSGMGETYKDPYQPKQSPVDNNGILSASSQQNGTDTAEREARPSILSPTTAAIELRPIVTSLQPSQFSSIIDTPIEELNGSPVYVSHIASAMSSQINSFPTTSQPSPVNAVDSSLEVGGELLGDQSKFEPSPVPNYSNSFLSQLNGLQIKSQPQYDENGYYISPFRRQSSQSGSSVGRRGSGQSNISADLPSDTITKQQSRATASSTLPVLPEAEIPSSEQENLGKVSPSGSARWRPSAAAKPISSYDSDDDDDDIVYGDPAAQN